MPTNTSGKIMDLENYQCLLMILVNYNRECGALKVLHNYPNVMEWERLQKSYRLEKMLEKSVNFLLVIKAWKLKGLILKNVFYFK